MDGHSKQARAGIKHETFEREYDPRKDTCVKAFVRLIIAMLAEREAAQDTTDTQGEVG